MNLNVNSSATYNCINDAIISLDHRINVFHSHTGCMSSIIRTCGVIKIGTGFGAVHTSKPVALAKLYMTRGARRGGWGS